MLNLFVDGSHERMAVAYHRMPSDIQNSTVWARTAEEAISALKDYCKEFQVVSFVHDLNENVRGDTRRDDSGMAIVRWLEKQNSDDWKHCKFIAHGWDASDSKMVYRLDRAGFNAKWFRFGE